jgi:hypothetical protein
LECARNLDHCAYNLRSRSATIQRGKAVKLLSHESSNAKLALNANVAPDWETYILYLAPADTVAGLNLCPAASAGCRAACLYTAGRGAMSNVQEARVRKTEFFRDDRPAFMLALAAEIGLAVRRALKSGKRLAVRLNGTSDVDWENLPAVNGQTLMQLYPSVTFYDYTKRPERAAKSVAPGWPPNYKLTFSRSEANETVAKRLAERGVNVAAVFAALPATYLDRPVIDGTLHDMRFLDPAGVVVGLTAKGRAKRDTSGFVIKEEVA